MEVLFDSRKAQRNLLKHGVSFDEALTALYDPMALCREDPDAVGESGARNSSMRKDYDFSRARRAKDVPHLSRLRVEATGKTRITIMLDNIVLEAFRAQAEAEGVGYQTLINKVLREHLGAEPVTVEAIRRVLREELSARR